MLNHEPASRDARPEPSEGRVWYECMSCGGAGDHGFDDEGKRYVCHGCGAEGGFFGPASLRAELNWRAYLDIEREVIKWAARNKARRELGVPDGWAFYLDRDSCEFVMRPPPGHRPPACESSELDDIPY